MTNQTEIWKQTLYKALDDSVITQTIAIFEDDATAFRVVQLYDLKRNRTGKTAATLASRAAYCLESVWESRETAIVEAQRKVAKHLMDQWRICCDEQTNQEAS